MLGLRKQAAYQQSESREILYCEASLIKVISKFVSRNASFSVRKMREEKVIGRKLSGSEEVSVLHKNVQLNSDKSYKTGQSGVKR